MPIQTRLLRIEIAKQAEPQIRRKIRSLVKLDFDTKKEAFMERFEKDLVTQELRAGPEAMSSFISDTEGNLFSLLGFKAGKEPADELKSFLDESIKLQPTRKGEIQGDKLVYATPVEIPTVAEVNDAMSRRVPLKWSSRGFTDLIARGISGLPFYLFSLTRKFKNSQSGTAIEIPNKLRTGSTKPIPYIGPLLGLLKRSISFHG